MTSGDPHPFRWCDIQIYMGQLQLDVFGDKDSQLRAADWSGMTFTVHKSGVPGEIVGHTHSGALHACPVVGLAELCLLLRKHGATHLDLAPPPVAVGKGTTYWISKSAVQSTLRIKKVVLPGLIASVRGEPDIHSAVGTLPHEAAPLLDQMRLKGTPVKIDGPPLTPEQLAAAIAYGSHNSCNRVP